MTSQVAAEFPATPDVGSLAGTVGTEEPTPTEVLITAQEVAFSTAAALSLPRRMTRGGWLNATVVAAIRRILIPPPRPRPRCLRHEPYYFEAARMSREIGRL